VISNPLSHPDGVDTTGDDYRKRRKEEQNIAYQGLYAGWLRKC
jgi:hypothetical protein